MTKIDTSFLSLTLVAIFASCSAQNLENVNNINSDTVVFKIDTTINSVLIDGEEFSLNVLRDKFDEHLQNFTDSSDPYFEQSPMTVILTNKADGKVMYRKKFDFEPGDYPYLHYRFYKALGQGLNDNGKLYLVLNKGYGGSGSGTIRYYISFKNGKVNFSALFNASGELSYIVYKKNDKGILVLDGLWSSKDSESHFGNHRYMITMYTCVDNTFDKEEIGQTKFKYSSLDDDKPVSQILIDIKAKEPLLLKGINLSEYHY